MEKKSLVILTTESILDYIKNNELEVGDRLPNEYDLSTELNVSRSTFREAVKVLVAQNVLQVKQGSGTYINSTEDISEDFFGLNIEKDPLKLTNDLFELRYILEPKVAAKAALEVKESDLKELKKIKEEIESVVMDEDTKHFELDIQFHTIIARASNNAAMYHLIPIINKSIWLYNDFYTSYESKMDMITLHEEIYNAIKNKDPVAAEDSMTLHIGKIRHALKTINIEGTE